MSTPSNTRIRASRSAMPTNVRPVANSNKPYHACLTYSARGLDQFPRPPLDNRDVHSDNLAVSRWLIEGMPPASPEEASSIVAFCIEHRLSNALSWACHRSGITEVDFRGCFHSESDRDFFLQWEKSVPFKISGCLAMNEIKPADADLVDEASSTNDLMSIRLIHGPVVVDGNAREGAPTVLMPDAAAAARPAAFYSQADDVTMKEFIKGGNAIVGKSAVDKLIRGNNATAKNVRADPHPSDDLLPNVQQSLHEIIPTSLATGRDKKVKIAKIADVDVRNSLARAQSGLRVSPACTIFRNQKGLDEAVGHIGTFYENGVPGTFLTAGEKAAHDVLRVRSKKIIDEGITGKKAVVHMASAHLESTADGKTILAATNLAAQAPAVWSSLSAVGEIKSRAEQVKLAQIQHKRRELVKVRTVAVNNQLADPLSRPVTPLRTSIKDDESGGDHTTPEFDASRFPQVAVPTVPQEDVEAHLGAWITEPQRVIPK